MANKKPGYVYILTNPSFRKDWVKIGMTQNMEERLRTLDTTSLPLPFKKYATLKTVKYQIAEKHVHHYIERFTNLRIRANREFFNVTPEEALSIFCEVAELLDDAEIEVFDENAKKQFEKEKAGKKNRTQRCTTTMATASTTSNVWFICYDKARFDVEACLKKLGQVYWMHRGAKKNVKKGDVAYLYSNSPESAVRFKVEVIDSQMSYSSEMDVENEFSSNGASNSYGSKYKYFLVRLSAETHSPALKLSAMISNGVIGARASTTILTKEEYKPLKEYIEKHFEDVD